MALTHIGSLSGKGQRADQFRSRILGIAVDADDRLFALGDRQIKRFSSEGKFEAQFTIEQLGWCLFADSESIWVGRRHGVDRYDFDGNLKSSINDERLGLVTSIAVTGDTLLVADVKNRTIHLFKSGQWQREIGQDVNTRGFMIPNGVLDLAIDSKQNSFVVAHPQKHRVERYDLNGKLTHKFGRFGMEHPADFGGCCNPTNITTTSTGAVVVSEKAPPRVKVYAPSGKYIAQSAEGVFDANSKNIDLATDRRNRLFATDSQRCTIEVFELDALSN